MMSRFSDLVFRVFNFRICRDFDKETCFQFNANMFVEAVKLLPVLNCLATGREEEERCQSQPVGLAKISRCLGRTQKHRLVKGTMPLALW